MSGTDAWNVAAAFDKSSYNAGDTMTITLSGGDVLTTTTTGSVGPLTIAVAAADGAMTTITVAAVPATMTVATPESVKITGITDSGTPPRTWTIGANGLTATAIA